MSKFIKFNSLDDVSFTRSGSQMNLHLASGQIVEVAYDVVKESFKAMESVQEPKQDLAMRDYKSLEERVMAFHGCITGRWSGMLPHETVEPFPSKRFMQWPITEINAPVWRTADGRALPVTEMDNYHLSNALRKVQTIIRSYPNTKNIGHYKQWVGWFSQEFERRRGR